MKGTWVEIVVQSHKVTFFPIILLIFVAMAIEINSIKFHFIYFAFHAERLGK